MGKIQKEDLEYLGSITKNNKDIECYKSNEEVYLYYPNVYYTSEKISDVLNNQDNYLWTPYLDFIEFLIKN